MISRHDEELFLRAAETARKGEHHRVRVGAVLRHRLRTIEAWNVIGPVPNEPYYPGHAEQQLIPQAQLNSTLYVARLALNDDLMMSKPCPTCMAAIESSPISRVVYWNGRQLVEERTDGHQ